MVRRPLRSSFSPLNQPRLIETLGEARAFVIKFGGAEKPSSDRYRKCLAVTQSIDALVGEITGDAAYFHAKPKPSDAPAEGVAESVLPSSAAIEETAGGIIADCGGDPRAAVIELVVILHSLVYENRTLREAASPGFARRRPLVFGASS
jgi:hypothetical protein